ncbi:MAG: hypothetical protein IKX23_04815 [Treponema sp.]|nr:hypothetical protein [Treponema sp.]
MKVKKVILSFLFLIFLAVFLLMLLVIFTARKQSPEGETAWVCLDLLVLLILINIALELSGKIKNTKFKNTVSFFAAIILICISASSFVKAGNKQKIALDNETEYIEEQYFVQDIDELYLGTYYPVDFINTLTATKSYVKAVNSLSDDHDFVINVRKNIITGAKGFDEQKPYLSERVQKFIFTDFYGETSFTDDNNIKYVKVSEQYDFESVLCKFVIDTIFYEYSDTIHTYNSKIEIGHKTYSFVSNCSSFAARNIPNLYIKDERNVFAARFTEDLLVLYYMDLTPDFSGRTESDAMPIAINLVKSEIVDVEIPEDAVPSEPELSELKTFQPLASLKPSTEKKADDEKTFVNTNNEQKPEQKTEVKPDISNSVTVQNEEPVTENPSAEEEQNSEETQDEWEIIDFGAADLD